MTDVTGTAGPATSCRVCAGVVHEFLDFGRQPLSDALVSEQDLGNGNEFFFQLAVGCCESCTMIQLMEEVPRDRMFHDDYPYYSSGSAVMREHFEQTAQRFLDTELAGTDPFIVEIGCNDGVMLKTISKSGVRHLGVEPSKGVADVARSNGVRVRTDFFEESTAVDIRAEDGPADVIYAANAMCHIPYVDSIFRGVDALLGPDGVFVFEDPYWGDIVEKTSFDQIYDEHFFYFTARSVHEMAKHFGYELVDVEGLSVHGGEVRYTLARSGRRRHTKAVADLLSAERVRDISGPATLSRFAANVERTREDLAVLLGRLRTEGRTVVAYGATAKSATVANFCGIGPDLVSCVYDTTPAKQGKLTPGMHIPVEPADGFTEPYPDYALLFAWNHAEEIMNKERGFREAGGRWIMYVPDVHLV